MDTPTTRYTKVNGLNLAYQVHGEGPQDLLIVPGVFSHLDLMWTDPGYAHFMRRLGSFARVITYDRLGVGLSEGVEVYPTIDDRLDEITAVLDATGADSVNVLGYSEGGAYAGYFAATQPSRIKTITFCVPWVRGPRDDRSQGLDPETFARFDHIWNHWGEGESFGIFFPSLVDTPFSKRLAGSMERLIASPGVAKAIFETALTTDVSAILPQVRVPSLVVGVSGDPIVPIEHVRMIADSIPGARLHEVAGRDHSVWTGVQDPMLDEIERFITGAVREHVDRMFATVVFTDIVGSTERLAAVGDQAWRKLVEEHDRCVRFALVEHGGREVKSLGDGFLMTFPAPHAALRALQDIHHDIRQLGLEIRAGIHAGDVEIVGADLAGLTVNTAARISALAGAGEVLVSETVRDLLRPSGTDCAARGSHDLKGVPGKQQLFAAAEPSRIAVDEGGPKVRVRDRMLLSMARRAPGLARSFTARLQARTAPAA